MLLRNSYKKYKKPFQKKNQAGSDSTNYLDFQRGTWPLKNLSK